MELILTQNFMTAVKVIARHRFHGPPASTSQKYSAKVISTGGKLMYAVYAVESSTLVKRDSGVDFELAGKRNAMVREWYMRRGLQLLVLERAFGEVNPPAIQEPFACCGGAIECVPFQAKYSPKIIEFCRNLSIGNQSI
jgi:hypothetical protein